MYICFRFPPPILSCGGPLTDDECANGSAGSTVMGDVAGVVIGVVMGVVIGVVIGTATGGLIGPITDLVGVIGR